MRSERVASMCPLAYDRSMRFALLVSMLAGCPGAADKAPDHSRIPKKPNTELIHGVFEKHPPAGTTAFKFDTDATVVVAKSKAELERTPYIMEAKYTVEGDKLTFEAVRGECAESAKTGSYKVNLSKVGLRFVEKIEDACEWRGKLVGQTLWRVK